MVIQGRKVTSEDIHSIRRLIEANPSWHRTRISRELCSQWKWCTEIGQPKDMACRSLLLKLEEHGHITLPARIKGAHNSARNKSLQYVLHSTTPINSHLQSLLPLRIFSVQNRGEDGLFKTLLSLYHYLGYSGTVGENIKYIVRDRANNPLACLLFGSDA